MTGVVVDTDWIDNYTRHLELLLIINSNVIFITLALQFTTACNKSSQFALLTPIFCYRLSTVNVLLPLNSDLFFNHSNSGISNSKQMHSLYVTQGCCLFTH
jgi:hypothetical protein